MRCAPGTYMQSNDTRHRNNGHTTPHAQQPHGVPFRRWASILSVAILAMATGACSSTPQPASTSDAGASDAGPKSACATLASCCPITETPAACKATADLGNEQQCKTTYATFQDAKKCPKEGADWACSATRGTARVCESHTAAEFGKVPCDKGLTFSADACDATGVSFECVSGAVTRTIRTAEGVDGRTDAEVLCAQLEGTLR